MAAELIRCPQCERQLRVPDALLGKKVKCPSCGTTFAATAAPPAEPEAEVEPEEGYQERPRRPQRRRPQPEDEDDEEAPDEEPEEEDEPRPHRRRRRRRSRGDDYEKSWIDQQFTNTPLVLLILFPLCCGMVAVVFDIVGVAACRHPVARRNAIMVLCISAVWIVGGGLLALMGVFGKNP